MGAPAASAVEGPAAAGRPHYPLLDSLRGIAALSVFAAHAAIYLDLTAGEGSPLLTRLDPGIAIFLLLSAFLLYRPFARARLDGRPAPSVFVFALRRFVRIVPLYWLALTVVALYFNMDYVFTSRGLVTYYGFLQVYDPGTITNGIGQAWTICVEVSFYVMLPLWAFALRRVAVRSTRGFLVTELSALAVLFVASVAWKLLVFAHTPEKVGFGIARLTPGLFTLPAYLDMFAVGMALAVVSLALERAPRQPRLVRLVDMRPWAPWLAAAALYWLSGLVGASGAAHLSGPEYVAHQDLNVLVALLLFLPAVFGRYDRGWLRRALRWRPLLWIAILSYGIYLWHLPVLTAIVRSGDIDLATSPALFVAAGLALTIALAWPAYLAVGRPFINLGHRVRPGTPARLLARLRGDRRAEGPQAAEPPPSGAQPDPERQRSRA